MARFNSGIPRRAGSFASLLCETWIRMLVFILTRGRRLFAGLSGGHKQLSYISFDIPPSDQPIPAWLADLAEALVGFRLTGDNTLELLRVDQQNSILHNVAGKRIRRPY